MVKGLNSSKYSCPSSSQNPACPKTLTTLGDHIRKRHLDLGLWQKVVAATLGVTVSGVTNWELNRVIPYFTYLPKIIAFLGYIPPPFDKMSSNIIEQMKLYRLTHGMSQERFAKLVGEDETTVAQWERGEHKPTRKLIKRLSAFFNDEDLARLQEGYHLVLKPPH